MTVNVQLQKPEAGGYDLHIRPGLCIGKLAEITEAKAGEYGPNMNWWWEIWYTGPGGAKDPIAGALDETGKPVRLRDMTSTKFGKGKTPDKTAKARVRVEALLKREIDDNEPLDGLLDQCLGKPALLYLVATEAGYLNVQLVQPYKSGTLAPMPAAPEEPYDGGASMSDDEQVPF